MVTDEEYFAKYQKIGKKHPAERKFQNIFSDTLVKNFVGKKRRNFFPTKLFPDKVFTDKIVIQDNFLFKTISK